MYVCIGWMGGLMAQRFLLDHTAGSSTTGSGIEGMDPNINR